ncbi:MAG: PAS domain S-box protein [Promethearchaeota archaeon]
MKHKEHILVKREAKMNVELQRIERKLKESEEKYKSILEHINELYYEVDIKGNFTFFNSALPKYIGYTRKELLNMHYSQLYDEKTKKKVFTVFNNLYKAGEGSHLFDHEVIKKSGEKLFVESSVYLRYDSNGKIIGFRGLVRDITDRKKAEQELKESEEKYRALIQNFQGIAFQGYADFSAAFFQGAVEEITGYSEYDFISGNINWGDLIHQEDLPKVRKDIKKFHNDPNIQKGKREYRISTKNGEIKWILELNQYFYDNIKKREGVRGIVVDITEKKMMEKKLRASEQKYRNLIETSSMGLMEIDFVKGGIIYINPRLLNIIGYSKEQLNDENIFYKVIFSKDLKKIRDFHGEQNIEFKLLNKEGKIIWLSGLVRNEFDYQGNLLKSRLWLKDITEKKEIAEMKSNLITRFSHEFKTPLISIKGFTDLILTDYSESLNNTILSFLKRIKDGAERLRILINNFIESSLLDKHLVELARTRENLSDLIKKGIEELDGMIRLRKHTISLNIPDILIIEIDKTRIYNLITNLLLNSIKYTPKGGNILIQVVILKSSVITSIKDNGIGLNQNEIEQLFKPFGKIEKYGEGWDIISDGIGLGLYLSKEIIELHGGNIWIESEGRGKGTTCSFSLPYKKH